MDSVNIAMILVIALLNLGFATLVAALLTDWQLRGQTAAWVRQRRAPLRTLRLCATLWVALMLIVVLVLETSTMAEVPLFDIAPSLGPIMTSTHFGHVWLGSFVAVAVALVLQRKRTVPNLAFFLCSAALLAFAVTRSLVSHAVVAGNVSWPVAIETLHLLLISIWVGEVLISGLYMLRDRPGSGVVDRDACGRYIESLSTSATIALTGILATGLVNSWRGLGSVTHLFDNAWGLILIAKLTMVFIAAGLGAYNRWIVMPGLLSGLKVGIDVKEPHQRFRLVLKIEILMLVCVVFAAAFLSASSPPNAS